MRKTSLVTVRTKLSSSTKRIVPLSAKFAAPIVLSSSIADSQLRVSISLSKTLALSNAHDIPTNGSGLAFEVNDLGRANGLGLPSPLHFGNFGATTSPKGTINASG